MRKFLSLYLFQHARNDCAANMRTIAGCKAQLFFSKSSGKCFGKQLRFADRPGSSVCGYTSGKKNIFQITLFFYLLQKLRDILVRFDKYCFDAITSQIICNTILFPYPVSKISSPSLNCSPLTSA